MLCIPIRCRGEVIGVLTRESAPSFGRQPGELERTYVDIFNRFARMIAAGDFPFDAEDAETEEAPRVGDGVILLDAAQRVEYTSPNGVSALHRVGVHANSEGLRLRRARARRHPRPHGLLDQRTGHRGARGAGRRVRARPVHPVDRPRRGVRRGGADAGRVRAASPGPAPPVQGRHDPRDPPPGEEQPADDLVAAAPAGPTLHVARGQDRHRGVGAPDPRRSRSCTRRCRARRATTSPSSRSCGRWLRMVEEGMSSEDRPVSFTVEGDAGFLPGHRRHAAVGGAQRAAPERDRPRLPGRPRPQGRAGPGRGRGSPTTARGCR